MKLIHGKTYNIDGVLINGQCTLCRKRIRFTESANKHSGICCGFVYTIDIWTEDTTESKVQVTMLTE